MDIIQKNALIDVFMETTGRAIPVYDQHGKELSSDFTPNNYHCDWNLLMDVVQKIESLDYFVKIIGMTTFIYSAEADFKTITSVSENSKRESLYNAVVTFIQVPYGLTIK